MTLDINSIWDGTDRLLPHIMSLLIEIEPEDEEAQANTPTRFVRAYNEILSGYTTSPETVIGKDFEQVVKDDLVIVKNIPFYSLCKHHMLPFFGDVSIGYLPTDKILGLSKFPRLVKCLSQRLQVQENLGRQICDILHNSPLKPKGVICVINARHLCMEMRGIESKGSTITASIAGAFVDNSELKREFYHLIG